MGLAVIFPGQGTQHAQMGVPWRATPSWEIVARAEESLGRPLAHLLLDASDDELGRTLEAQLAVFLHSLMAWQAAANEIPEPVAFAGHSLGQLTALVASQALTVEDGVRLVAERATATQAAADRHPGRMIALIGADLDVAGLVAAPGEGSWIANDNAPGQVVLGGTPDGIEAAAERAKALGVRRVIALKVGGAFHTPLFAEARDALRPVLAMTTFRRPVAPVVSNVDGQPHTDPADWPVQLADHLVSPVRWRESLLTLSQLGADSLLEAGPGNVLAGLAKRTLPGVPVRNLAVPGDTPILTSLEVC